MLVRHAKPTDFTATEKICLFPVFVIMKVFARTEKDFFSSSPDENHFMGGSLLINLYSQQKSTTMKTKMEIVKAGIEKKRSQVEGFRQQLNELMANECGQIANEYDIHPHLHHSESIAEVHLMADQFETAAHELDELQRLEFFPEAPHSSVEFGTVVKTNRETFFISAELDQFAEEDGTPILGIPVHSPLYQAMKRKCAGDCFEFSGNIYRIKEII